MEFLFKILRVMCFPSNMLNWYFGINELSLLLYFHRSSVHYSAQLLCLNELRYTSLSLIVMLKASGFYNYYFLKCVFILQLNFSY